VPTPTLKVPSRVREIIRHFHLHHEGSWPHSAEAIERQMGDLSDKQRAKILGLNAAKLFNFAVPKDYVASYGETVH